MKRLFGFFAALCLFVATPAAAQFNFGIKAGVNLSQKPTTDIEAFKNNLKGSTGWYVGPTAKYIFPIVGLGVEANVLYSQTNVEIEGQTVMSQSIDVPLYLRYELTLPVVNKFVEPFIAIGPQFTWNIGSEAITLDNIGEYTQRSYKVKDSNVSLNLGLGVILFDHLQIHGNYNLALGRTAEFTTIKSGIEEAFESKTNIWQISIAYIF